MSLAKIKGLLPVSMARLLVATVLKTNQAA
jgi:hypothetical protein